MNRETPIPRLLVVDDDHAQIEMMKRIFGEEVRLAHAGTADDAVDLLLRPASTRDPFKIIILDMALPRNKRDERTDKATGKKLLTLLDLYHRYQLPSIGTRIIIFTAFPSYQDCVYCMKHSAEAYIPKSDPSLETGGIGALVDRVRVILHGNSVRSDADECLAKYGKEVAIRNTGSCIAAVPEEAWKASRLKLPHKVRDGFHILSTKSYEEMKILILRNEVLRWQDVRILEISPARNGYHA